MSTRPPTTTAEPAWPDLGTGMPAGPVAVLAHSVQLAHTVEQLRALASHHSDTAWVHPAPADPKTSLPNLSQDLLDALGAVGRREPRSAGERHLLRALVHLIHGPVRNVIVDDAQLLTVDALDALHEASLVARVQLWFLCDAAQRPPRTPTANPDPRAWMTNVCDTISPTKLIRLWEQRDPGETCSLPPHTWWHQDPNTGTHPCASACSNPTAHASDREQVDCVLGLARRAMTAGHTTATHVRHRIAAILKHPETTVDHYWALTAVDREPWTAGMDALGQTHPYAQRARLADVTPDGASVCVATDVELNRSWVDVHLRHQPAVARLRTSRRIAGCVASDLLDGVFDEDPGVRTPRTPRTPQALRREA